MLSYYSKVKGSIGRVANIQLVFCHQKRTEPAICCSQPIKSCNPNFGPERTKYIVKANNSTTDQHFLGKQKIIGHVLVHVTAIDTEKAHSSDTFDNLIRG